MKPRKTDAWKLLLLALLLAAATPDRVFSQDAAAPPPPPAGEVETKSALDIYKEGGWFMHVLLVCSIGTIAVVVYCFVQITPKKMAPKSLVDRVNSAMAGKDVGTAYQICQATPNAYSNVVSSALLKVNFERDLANKVSMVEAAAEGLDEEEHRQMVWVNYLNVFATLAPMIGLLGTVWGMIESFDQLAAGNAQPQDLAGGIKKAMGTTAGGLLVGIPAMFFYFFFRDKLQGVMTTIQKHASFAIDILSGEIRLEGAAEESHEPPAES
ncbi:MAG: MotA/TolQ/ExbB proton channel family protein [Verrucomicrobiae bacterium]|nr:MotA/TolQ/ExbB proton channel family protein [Verrucomicrobiae bacterium]MCP5541691.1 MotA/TolQ/ExbB proton channel family protein [Akkermansiaceae bacterium]MCP5551679.1 MotA/TolQ/ExbB proton channel family protein [Akkermansiaceae bacterium]